MDTQILDSEATSTSTDRDSRRHGRHGRHGAAFSETPDPSFQFLVDPPRRHTRFQSWFALAFFSGILMGLLILAMIMG